MEQIADNVFPLEAPYCNVDLTPKWDFDIELAHKLACASSDHEETSCANGPNGVAPVDDEELNEDAMTEESASLLLGLGFGLRFVVLLGFLCW